MRLSAKIIKNVNSVNSWTYTNQSYMAEGQPNTLYLQLVDLDISTSPEPEKSLAFPQFPMRYISQATTLTSSVTFQSIDDSAEFSISGTQPFAQDKSIWKFDLGASQVPASGYIKVSIIEDSVTKSFVVKNAITVETLEIGGC